MAVIKRPELPENWAGMSIVVWNTRLTGSQGLPWVHGMLVFYLLLVTELNTNIQAPPRSDRYLDKIGRQPSTSVVNATQRALRCCR
eukprot:scaffold25646_cov64-Cyclotella_meneghiniana.AAC.3